MSQLTSMSHVTNMSYDALIEEINQLKKEKDAIILVHNYQRPEIYKVADYIGDSLGLSQAAVDTDAKIIVFCGVDFMAESASILNPYKKVLLPAIEAKCPMAAMVNAYELRQLKKKHPNAAVVCYINTTAEVKAESDICCTSSNAVRVVNSLEQDEVIFVPDKNLTAYVQKHTDKTIIPWEGWCYVHNKFSAEALKRVKEVHPHAKIVIHPECKPGVVELADYVTSTSGMLRYAQAEANTEEFIIGTEVGLVERLKLELPEKTFYQAPPGGTCIQMKKNTLDKVFKSLKNELYVVKVAEGVRIKAKQALDRMLKVA